MTDYRRLMDPSTLDTLMFMRSNSDLWLRDAEIWIDRSMKEAAETARLRRLQLKIGGHTPISSLSTNSSIDDVDDDTYTL